MFPASGDSSYSTGPNPDPSQGNFVRLVRDTSFLRLPKQQANQGPKGNVLVAQNLVFKGTHALCRNKCFKNYNTMKDITHDIESDREYESDWTKVD